MIFFAFTHLLVGPNSFLFLSVESLVKGVMKYTFNPKINLKKIVLEDII